MAGGVAQVVEHLSSKDKALGTTNKKKKDSFFQKDQQKEQCNMTKSKKIDT
jgi:hypothetical protein